MKVLGITPSSKDVSWALVGGTRSEPELIPLESKKQRYPTGQSDGQVLYNLYKYALTFLNEQAADKVCILEVGNNPYGGQSFLRIKVEGIFQLACAELNIPVDSFLPQSLRAQEKKFIPDVGDTPENTFNGGKDFKPKPWKDCVVVAWTGLEE